MILIDITINWSQYGSLEEELEKALEFARKNHVHLRTNIKQDGCTYGNTIIYPNDKMQQLLERIIYKTAQKLKQEECKNVHPPL